MRLPLSINERLRFLYLVLAKRLILRRSVTHHYYRGANAVVLVYDVTNKTSLVQLDHWLEELESHGVGVDIPR